VSETLVANSSYLAAAAENQPGDGVVAGRIANLDVASVTPDGQRSIPEAYQAIANAVAVSGHSTNEDLQAAESVMMSLTAQRESISGVNLDEEAISLVKYERAFQGAARYLSTVDQLIGELVAILR
jgi:flagellar hook-associated protein 1 FlgK